MYEQLKQTHVVCVTASGALFLLRYYLLRRSPQQLLPVALRVLPHVNDTILLLAAIGMLVVAGLNPLRTPWLLTKIVFLCGYIVLGALCLRAPPGSRRQTLLFVGAASVFTYIVVLAITKQVIP